MPFQDAVAPIELLSLHLKRHLALFAPSTPPFVLIDEDDGSA